MSGTTSKENESTMTPPKTPDDTGATTQDAAEKAPQRLASYTVLEKVVIDHEPDEVFEAWRVIGRDVRARKDTDAISQVLGEDDGANREFVAVSRFNVRKPEVKTVTRRSFS
jgi:hypothetical protein